MALTAIFMLICTWAFFTAAIGNDQGLQFDRTITLSVQGATIFYWALGLFCAAVATMGVLAIVRAFGKPRFIVLNDETLTAPKSQISSKIITLKRADITRLRVITVFGQTVLRVHNHGKTLEIAVAGFASREDFDEFYKRLEKGLELSQPNS